MTTPAARNGAPHSPRVIATVAALVVLAAAVFSISPDPVGVFWDDGVYLLLAKALAAGDGYRYMHLPGAPAAIHYPPAFPLLLAALLKVTPAFPANVAVLKLLNPVCLACGVFGAVRLGEQRLGLGDVPSAIAVVICALTSPVLLLSNVLLSEPLFLAVLVGAIWLVDAATARGGTRAAVLAGLAIAVLTLVRTVGGVLLPAALAMLWWKRRRREALVTALVAAITLLPWQLWVWHAARGFPAELRGSYGPYLGWVLTAYRAEPMLAWNVAVLNVVALWHAFGVIFAPHFPRVVQWVAAALAAAAVTAGLVALARRASVLAPFLLVYVAVAMLWPYDPWRIVSAVWPLTGLVLLAAAREVGTWGALRWRHAPRLSVVVVSLLLAGHAAYALRGLAGGWASTAPHAMAQRQWPLVQWTVTHAGPRDVVASDSHVMIALYTGRTTMPVSMLTPAEYVRRKTATEHARELRALVDRFRPQLLVYTSGSPELDALPLWAAMTDVPAVTLLPPIPGGGAAFALRDRP